MSWRYAVTKTGFMWTGLWAALIGQLRRAGFDRRIFVSRLIVAARWLSPRRDGMSGT
jgi:hypothetical protein